ncbi:MAG: hypothetical protein Q8940_13535 [Bacteroidota bacterium]|nr:hypothetical protein [Bacteroidota bacterium]
MKNKSKLKFAWNKKLLFFMIMLPAIMVFQVGCATGGYDSRSSSDGSYSDESYRDDGNYADEEAVLDEYGEWIIVPHYGTVWRPFVSANWQPYYYGNWMRTENGWTWLSYEPFGWIVYHYGYWDYTPQTGWFWIESNDWSPARVEWQSYGDYIGWAPMAPPGASFEQTREAFAYRWTFVQTRDFTRENIGRYRLRNSPSFMNPTEPPDIRTVETYQNHQVRIVKTSRARRTVDGRQFDRMIVPERENATVNRYEPHILGDVVRRRDDPRTIERRNNTFNGNSPITPVTPSGTNSSPTRQSNTTVSPRTNTGNTNTTNPPANGSTNGTRNTDGTRGRASESQEINKPNGNNQSKDNKQSRGGRSRTRNNGANTPSSGSNVPANPNGANPQPPASGQGNTRQGRATDERDSKAAPTKTRNSEENKKSGNGDNSNSRDNGSREEKRDGNDRSR